MSGGVARVALVGFEDQDNLGLRYLSSTLRQAGHATRFVALGGAHAPLFEALREFEPDVVGFSLIFQYLVPHFAALLRDLRSAGVRAHFTMGGHYASFEPEALLEAIPELDSVVRFEGEDTLLELASCIASAAPWTNVRGIAWRDGSTPRLNPTRVGRADLDTLPWPDRDDIRYDAHGLPTASIIAGRGCPWRCSFCSIITFYEGNGTKGRRRRAPSKVVDEMEHLCRERGVRIVLFQDDDFLAGGRAAVVWAHEIARECVHRGLAERLRWKISCRSDEISEAVLAPLVEAGLCHVYMGVESGDPTNLANLDKRLKPAVHHRAGGVLRKAEVSFDFGFMLFEPWSTLPTVRNNISFLREFAGDGAAAVSFCRTLPYAGTKIEGRLRDEGRLNRQDPNADYAFLDPKLDALYDWSLRTFAERHSTATGTANLLRLALFEANLDLPERPVDREFLSLAKRLASVANRILLDTVEAATDHVESEPEIAPDDRTLAILREHHEAEDERIRSDLVRLIRTKPDLAEHLHVLR